MTSEQELAKAIYEALLSGVKPEVIAKLIEKLWILVMFVRENLI